MGPQGQFNRRNTNETQCKDLCDGNKGRRSIKLVVGQTTEGQTNSGIKVKICCTMLLHSKEGQIIMIGTGL